jgi:alpha-beta hydrolase superfamily lysophospholipase
MIRVFRGRDSMKVFRSIPQLWKSRRLRRIVAIIVAIGIIGANAMAYMQARAMTHFTDSKHRTLSPESLSAFQKIEVIFTGVRITRPENLTTPADVDLPFETFRFGGPTHDDCEAWYIPGDGKTLIIGFPGYVASKSSLLGAAVVMHEMGCDVMLVDFRGAGGSKGNQTTVGFTEAEDVADATDFAGRRWPGEREILYGQSMGGAAILRAIAQLHVSPQGVILESVYDRLLSTVNNRFHAMGLPAFPLARLLMFWGSVQMGYDAFDNNPSEYAEKANCPVLLMQGGKDPRVTDAEARNLYDHLAGPKVWDYYPAASHCEFLSRFPERWTASVKTFIASLPALPRRGP